MFRSQLLGKPGRFQTGNANSLLGDGACPPYCGLKALYLLAARRKKFLSRGGGVSGGVPSENNLRFYPLAERVSGLLPPTWHRKQERGYASWKNSVFSPRQFVPGPMWGFNPHPRYASLRLGATSTSMRLRGRWEEGAYAKAGERLRGGKKIP